MPVETENTFEVNIIGHPSVSDAPLSAPVKRILSVESNSPWMIYEGPYSYGDMRLTINKSDYTSGDLYVVYQYHGDNVDVYNLSIDYANNITDAVSEQAVRNTAQDHEIMVLKDLINKLIESSGSQDNIRLEYDDNGNLTNIQAK